MKNHWQSFSWCVVVFTACAGAPHVASSRVSAEDAAIIRVDSAAVETILAAIMEERAKYPSPSVLRVDVGADTRASSFRSVADVRRGSSAEQRYAIADSALLQLIADSRRRTLERLGVPVGGPALFPGCPSLLSYQGSDDSTARSRCPRIGHLSVAIQLPHRGEYPEVRSLQQRRNQPAPTYTGEIWSVAVSETGVGPDGGGWFLSVYVLSRDPQTGVLKVLDKVLYGTAE